MDEAASSLFPLISLRLSAHPTQDTMTEQQSNTRPERSLHLMLVDQDEVFRLGLRLWLEKFPDFQVGAAVGSAAAARQVLAAKTSREPDPVNGQTPLSNPGLEIPPIAATSPRIDFVILDTDLGEPAQQQGLTLCQAIKTQQATLPVLLLTSQRDDQLLAAAFQTGVDGYCVKGTAIAELVKVIRQIATGQKYWDRSIQVLALTPRAPAPARQSHRSGLPNLLSNLSSNGLREIETQLGSLRAQLQLPTLSWVERAFLTGRQREILAARWLVNQLMPATAPAVPGGTEALMTLPDPTAAPASANPLTLYPEQNLESQYRTLKSTLFDATAQKLQSSLENLTGAPLETDILKPEKKRELFYLVLRKLENMLDELRFSQVQPAQLGHKRSMLLGDLWQATTADFFGRYYTLQTSKRPSGEVTRDVELVQVLLQEAEIVQSELLDKIPLIDQLFNYLLFQAPLEINNQFYPASSFEAVTRTEALLQNLMIQVANAVLQPLLNHFADVEVLKQNFYDRRLISTRELERFRNALSWKYRLRRLVDEPKEIFESRFPLLVLQERGLAQVSIYASRDQELKQLSGLQLGVTIALEVRDAIAPPLRTAIAFLGKGVVYVLTQVIGRGIGLIGRGIIQGIGNSWQDIRYRKGQQQK